MPEILYRNKISNIFIILFILALSSCKTKQAETEKDIDNGPITVASYNIQYDNLRDTINSWSNRKPLLKELIQKYDFDIIGVQEPYLYQLNDIVNLLPEYAFLGTGVKGSVPVFYKKEKFTVIDTDIIWFSSTPNIRSVGWDASMQRKCRWVHFRELHSGKEFFLFNAHFDHLGKEARIQSAKILIEYIPKIAGDYPSLVTGDFNSNQLSDVYNMLTGSGVFIDSKDIAKKRVKDKWTSFNGFEKQYEPQKQGNHIDHIFLSKFGHNNQIEEWRLIADDFEGKYPSDHFPIMIKWIIN